jgi:hypothetical protein
MNVTDINRGWNWKEFDAKHAVRFALHRAGEAAEIVGAAPVSRERRVELHDGNDPQGRRRGAVI